MAAILEKVKEEMEKRDAIRKAARDALSIQEGACNGAGISLSLHEAYVAFLRLGGTKTANTSAPVKLILHQLAFLAGLPWDLDPEEYARLTEECKRLAESV